MVGAQGEIELPEFVWDEQTDRLLFRFFDKTVVPGRRYVYRIMLAIKDVNHGISEKYLAPVVSERLDETERTYRFTDWSETSPVVGVPLPGLIYLAGAEPANENSYTDEPEAELLVKTLNREFVAVISRADKFVRGSVINMMGVRPDPNTILATSSYEPEEGQDPKMDLETGITLLDFRGGGGLNGSRTLTAPARALLMTSAGRLIRQAELDDHETVNEYELYVEQAKKMRADQRDREEGGGRRRGGGGGGGYD